MEWTREQRYLPYEKHSALELLKLQAPIRLIRCIITCGRTLVC